jgi:hypothetical protein
MPNPLNKIKSLQAIAFNGALIVLVAFFSLILGLFLVYSNYPTFAAEETEEDMEPPLIYDVKVARTSATSSLITWKTNENSDALINFGLDKNYGVVRDSAFDKKEHSLEIPDLEANRTYYFRINSSDATGNQGISSDYIFNTRPLVVEKSKEEPAPAEQQPGAGEGTKLKEEGQGMGSGVTNEAGKGEGQGQNGIEGQGQGEGASGAEGQGQGEGAIGIEGLGGGVVESLTQTEAGQELVDAVQQILNQTGGSQEAMQLLADRLKDIGQGPFESPIIIEGYPEIAEIGTDFVIIRWLTTVAANSIVALVEDDNFNSGSINPYSWKEGEPSEYVSVHEVRIQGLKPATTYHYQAQSQGRVGPLVKSPDRIFTTKSILPQLFNIAIDKVEEDSATISWTTNVPCSSVIEYTNLESNDTRSEGSPNFVTRHSIRLTTLQFDTPYSAIIRVENEQGEKSSGMPISFTTVKDIVPPVISKLTTESTLYPGAETKIQTIISWDTDEPSVCQFFYHQGILQADQKPESLIPESGYVTKHIQVVTAFQPASVYKFWITCDDRTKNMKKSDDYTMLTPIKEQSILDLIISNFEGTFGWMKNMVPKK